MVVLSCNLFKELSVKTLFICHSQFFCYTKVYVNHHPPLSSPAHPSSYTYKLIYLLEKVYAVSQISMKLMVIYLYEENDIFCLAVPNAVIKKYKYYAIVFH